MSLQIVAVFAVHNEQLFMARVIEHLVAQGVASYVIDNESTDATAEIARSYIGTGVLGVESFPRRGMFEWEGLLRRKQELHYELDADWFIQHDADQFRYAPPPWTTLAEGIEAVDAVGYNAINFDVFDFQPTHQDEDFEDTDFVAAMRYYYYFCPPGESRNQIKAWKKYGQEIELISMGGHKVLFEGQRVYPDCFLQRHYMALSRRHAIEKYCAREYSPEEVARGWHGKRATVRPDDLYFPAPAELKEVRDGEAWDRSDPKHERLLLKNAR